jgi:hypothetical protein
MACVGPCFHRFCLECLMDFAEWCENWTRIVPKPMPRGTLFGQFADLHQNYNAGGENKRVGSDNDDGNLRRVLKWNSFPI